MITARQPVATDSDLSKRLAKRDAHAVELALDLAAHGVVAEQQATARAWLDENPDAVAKYAARDERSLAFVEKRREQMTEDRSPMGQLTKGLLAFCKAQNIDASKAWTVGHPKFVKTIAGAALQRAVEEG